MQSYTRLGGAKQLYKKFFHGGSIVKNANPHTQLFFASAVEKEQYKTKPGSRNSGRGRLWQVIWPIAKQKNKKNISLHGLHALSQDPGFGGLVRVTNKRQEFLWVHPQFEKEY